MVLFMLAIGLELSRTWLRRPALTVTADVMCLRGTGIDARLGWDDVNTIEYAGEGRWAAVGILAVPGAASYQSQHSRFLFPTDRTPPKQGLEIRVGLVSDVPKPLKLLRAMQLGGRARVNPCSCASCLPTAGTDPPALWCRETSVWCSAGFRWRPAECQGLASAAP